jgi:hypothetical protein
MHVQQTKDLGGRRAIMKKARNEAAVLDYDENYGDAEMWEGKREERTLVLKAVPRSRKVQLMAQGAKEIRCGFCGRIRPIAGAEELGDQWVCEDCLPAVVKESVSEKAQAKSRRRRGGRQEPGLVIRL